MATVTEKVKEFSIGLTTEPQLSEQSRHEFLKHAHQNDEGDYLMTEQEFINAIAPASEDYVCPILPSLIWRIALITSIRIAQD
jgi:solute carrier family 25 aspartate/glutamate transporter 12/13